MFLIIVLALFGNLSQLQLKYEHCKTVDFEGEYCSIQKKLHDSNTK
jgi:hypothetical protein